MSTSPAPEQIAIVSLPAAVAAPATQSTSTPTATVGKTADDLGVSLDYKSTHLKLDVATKDEALYHSKRNALSWKGPLEIEAYLRREAHLANTSFTRDGGLTTWVLLHTGEGHSERNYLAGCETYRKRALIIQDGQLEEITAYGIGSVFVPGTP